MIDGILIGLGTALTFQNLIMVMVGCLVGTFIGMLPGLGPMSAIALMIPIAIGFDPAAGVAFMLDQCHNIEPKIPGQIRSVLNVQEMTARALLVDRERLDAAQRDGDVLTANGLLMDAFQTDVRRDLVAWRESRGLAGDPMSEYVQSGYQRRIDAERVGGTQAGWDA